MSPLIVTDAIAFAATTLAVKVRRNRRTEAAALRRELDTARNLLARNQRIGGTR